MKSDLDLSVYIIDDDPEILTLLKKVFVLENYQVQTFLSALSVLEKLERGAQAPNLIICDLRLPDLDGMTFLERLKKIHHSIPVVFVTAHASVETAVQALKKGAFDYVVKPLHLTELTIIASRALQLQRLEAEKKSLQKQLNEQKNSSFSLGSMVGKSPKIRQVFDLIERVARSNSNILVTGESGTGKEMVARSIHQKSLRKEMPFVAINCSAIPDHLLESELFGHKKGAFTGAHETRRGLFEEANGGTIFLDEIGDMPLALQAKLLRVLQERKVKPVGENQMKDIDVRIISATHKNIRNIISEGKFREDLYYRISVIPIQLPPLRERKEDIPLMAEHFLKKHCLANQTSPKQLSKAALAKLMRLSWPGNVRELENTLERAVVLSECDLIDEVNIEVESGELSSELFSAFYSKLLTLNELEKSYIRYVLDATGNTKEKAAQILGINRKTLYRKEMDFGISSDCEVTFSK
jgi:DNA-binding NtrC family response regulator